MREFVDLARTDHGRRRMGRITSLESKATKGGTGCTTCRCRCHRRWDTCSDREGGKEGVRWADERAVRPVGRLHFKVAAVVAAAAKTVQERRNAGQGRRERERGVRVRGREGRSGAADSAGQGDCGLAADPAAGLLGNSESGKKRIMISLSLPPSRSLALLCCSSLPLVVGVGGGGGSSSGGGSGGITAHTRIHSVLSILLLCWTREKGSSRSSTKTCASGTASCRRKSSRGDLKSSRSP